MSLPVKKRTKFLTATDFSDMSQVSPPVSNIPSGSLKRPATDTASAAPQPFKKPTPWYKIAPHCPPYFLPKTCYRVSKKRSIPPHIHAFWTSKGHEQRVSLKQFQYVMNADHTYKLDHKGQAEVKSSYNGIELDPLDALRAIKVMSAMLKREGYTEKDLDSDSEDSDVD